MTKEFQQAELFDTTPFLTEQYATKSPINADKITGQNKTVYEYLLTGKPITSMQAIKKFGITRLGARIYDLKTYGNVTIYDRMIQEAGVYVKQYQLNPFPDVNV
jgi:hypothetical protein